MTYFLRRGTSFNPTSEAALDMHTELPAGNYIVKQDPHSGALYFDGVDSFDVPNVLYGNTTKHANRIMNTFGDRSASTGVLLTGEKGSGKTLLAKVISSMSKDLGYPTIIINAPWKGDSFNQLIQAVTQPCVVFFDEFEKVYDENDQEAILTLLDGVFPSKKLFLLTCNNQYRVNQHMHNRPGRLFYSIEFSGLEQQFIREYCNDRLDNKHHIDSVCQVGALFNQFNFDMLKALVEEMNRYNESPHEALSILNAKPRRDGGTEYDVALFINGERQVIDWPEIWNDSPVAGTERIEIHYIPTVTSNKKSSKRDCSFIELEAEMERGGAVSDSDDNTLIQYFTVDDITKVDPGTGIFTFTNRDGAVATFVRRKVNKFEYSMLA